jgi:hypothetical protein
MYLAGKAGRKYILEVTSYEDEDEKKQVDKEKDMLDKLKEKNFFVNIVESFEQVFCYFYLD